MGWHGQDSETTSASRSARRPGQPAPAFLDRLVREPGWRQEALDPRAFTIAIAGSGPLVRDLSVTAIGAGITGQVVVLPAGEHGAAIDVARDAVLRFGPAARVEPQVAAFHGPPQAEKVVYLVDAGDERMRGLRPPRGATVIGYAGQPGAISFGLDLWPPPACLRSTPGPSVPARAEARLLVAELVNACCALAECLAGPRGPLLAGPPALATIPLGALPPLETVRRHARLYIGGIGGAVSHQFLAALGLDPWLRRSLLSIWGADPDRVEVHNLARQNGYRWASLASGQALKAPLTADWIRRELADGETEVRAFAEPLHAAHFEQAGSPGFDAALGSVDSWAARRELATLAERHGVGALLSAGAAFTTAEARLATRRSGCLWRHGWERLATREDPPGTDGSGRPAASSCTQAEAQASSVVPQAFVGAWCAMALRDHVLGLPVDLRGIRVHLNTRGQRLCRSGLCWSPGSTGNRACGCGGFVPLEGEGSVA